MEAISLAERNRNMRQLLIEAGIEEINRAGVTNFSVRRVAQECGVSCAAPYKHFKDKRDFIASVIDYVNEQWSERQEEILAGCGGELRQQIVEVSVGYVRFLMEKPWFRAILMHKDEEFDSLYHHRRGKMSSRSRKMESEFLTQSGWSPETVKRKVHVVRAMLYGTIFLIDAGELEYGDAVLERVREFVEREFDLP